MRSLGGRADLSPAALRSPPVNQLNSLKIPTEFATSQGCGQSGSAILPAGGGDAQCEMTLITIRYRDKYPPPSTSPLQSSPSLSQGSHWLAPASAVQANLHPAIRARLQQARRPVSCSLTFHPGWPTASHNTPHPLSLFDTLHLTAPPTSGTKRHRTHPLDVQAAKRPVLAVLPSPSPLAPGSRHEAGTLESCPDPA